MPDSLGLILIVIASLIVGYAAIIAIIMYLTVKMLLTPERSIYPDNPDSTDAAEARAIIKFNRAWTDSKGLQLDGIYICKTLAVIRVALYRHVTEPVFIAAYLAPNRPTVYDIVSILDPDDHIGLTTSSTRDGHALPQPPGSYLQSLIGASLERMWIAHFDNEAFLTEQLRLRPKPLDEPPLDTFRNAAQRQARHVVTLSLWPLRAVWWFNVHRFTRANRSVIRQFESNKSR